jgi:GNAT superfamily N-acetyltransferase
MAERIGLLSVRAIRELQERAARAVPAAVQEHRDGCWLRHTDSTATWWAGAALMHGGQQGRDLEPRINAAEDFYAAHAAPARFQVCPACPPGLDDALSRRGYQQGGPVSLQVAAPRQIARHLSAPALQVELTESLDAVWFQLLMAAQTPDADPAPPEWRLLQRVDRPSAYATALISGRPVAVGRAVADAGWVGVFSMATLPGDRRHGAAGAVLAALADWAGNHGSTRMYLQVTRDSSAAARLYRRAGFQEACTYHYRAAQHAGRESPGGPTPGAR